MQLHTFANLLLLTNTVTADYLTAKSHRTGNNINLGHFSDVAAFHSVIGGQNGTSWEDITEYETFEDQAQPQSQSSNPSDPEATGLIRRADDYCSDLTGVTRMVCDNVPSRNWFWGAGGTLLIVYAPRTLERFLNVGCPFAPNHILLFADVVPRTLRVQFRQDETFEGL